MILKLFDFLDRNAWAPWVGLVLCIAAVSAINGTTFPFGLL